MLAAITFQGWAGNWWGALAQGAVSLWVAYMYGAIHERREWQKRMPPEARILRWASPPVNVEAQRTEEGWVVLLHGEEVESSVLRLPDDYDPNDDEGELLLEIVKEHLGR